jgi:glutamate 5-kinase
MAADADATPLRRELLASARRVVVKVGSQLIKDSPAGRPAAIADELSSLRSERGLEAVVVSSGAISLGMRTLALAKRPDDMPTLQAVAAVGQRTLLDHWGHAFAAHQRVIGQVLLTHDDIRDRRRFLNARHTLLALLRAGCVPIINENDTVAIDEIKYGDNDLLAALVCNLVSADALLILTDVDGLHDADPRQGGSRIPLVTDIDAEAAPVAGGAILGGAGSGGMASKVKAARVAGRSGIPTVVAPGRNPRALSLALGGGDIGTLFVPAADRMTSRKHWIAYGPKPLGAIHVDAGARVALVARGRSLLPAGVTSVTGRFEIGDTVSVIDENGLEFARGLTSYTSEDLGKIKGVRSADIQLTLGYKYMDDVIHRDDLVLL